MIKEHKITKKNITTILNIIIIINSILLLFLSYRIIKYVNDKKQIKDQLFLIEENITVEDTNNVQYITVVEQSEDLSKSNPYWDYIKMDLMSVDFSNLKTVNNEIQGWIQVNGTNINYPFVQGEDNKFYLTHSFDKSENNAGWVFLDYRNDLYNINEKNTILYAHGRMDKTMFGSLKNVLSKKWLNNKKNHVIKLSTEKENTLWQVFSVYRIPTTNDYIQTEFDDDTEYEEFIKMLINRSSYNFNTPVYKTDKILTLSTCYNNDDKMVLHAKLIKSEEK